jgi:aerobic-type carbon monoxide dehydrogenase small subunit (CoxS/CutS family)
VTRWIGCPARRAEGERLLAGATDEQIGRGREGNLCRCTGCTPIVAAERSVIEAGGDPAAPGHQRGR